MHEAPTAADLVDRAFGLARQSGKPEWWAMTIPVLKNRLLLLTKNTFREADFGATSFRDFLSKIPDVVTVNENPPPGFVLLKSASREHSGRSLANKRQGERIRADLWRAVLDYSSGRKYVWDISQQAARPATLENKDPVLPTVSFADLEHWRADFLALHKPTDPEAADRVEEWRRASLPTIGLPAPMRPLWNNYLKRKVERRLQDWFASNSIAAPAIVERGLDPETSDKEVEALRAFILACVKAMPKRELLELRISPTTALRTLSVQVPGSDENES